MKRFGGRFGTIQKGSRHSRVCSPTHRRSTGHSEAQHLCALRNWLAAKQPVCQPPAQHLQASPVRQRRALAVHVRDARGRAAEDVDNGALVQLEAGALHGRQQRVGAVVHQQECVRLCALGPGKRGRMQPQHVGVATELGEGRGGARPLGGWSANRVVSQPRAGGVGAWPGGRAWCSPGPWSWPRAARLRCAQHRRPAAGASARTAARSRPQRTPGRCPSSRPGRQARRHVPASRPLAQPCPPAGRAGRGAPAPARARLAGRALARACTTGVGVLRTCGWFLYAHSVCHSHLASEQLLHFGADAAGAAGAERRCQRRGAQTSQVHEEPPINTRIRDNPTPLASWLCQSSCWYLQAAIWAVEVLRCLGTYFNE